MNNKQKVQYAVFAAEQVIELFEKKYPDDKRPRHAIEAAKKWVKYQTSSYAAYAGNKLMKERLIRYGMSLLESKS